MNILLKGRCVTWTLADQCTAVRQYVRSGDVSPWVRVQQGESGSSRIAVGSGSSRTAVGSVARYMRNALTSGRLRYIKDPEGCDLWMPPWETFGRGGGDCDDLAIITARLCDMCGLRWMIVVGTVYPHSSKDGHAWVEGEDDDGFFLIEATNKDDNLWGYRHARYKRHHLLSPTMCAPAPEFLEEQARARQTTRQPAVAYTPMPPNPWGPYQGGR